MTDRIKDLLNEVADSVEPGDRLDAIRTATGVRRRGRVWWAAGGVGLVAAATIAAVVLVSGNIPPSHRTPPVATTGPSPTATEPAMHTVAVYYQGDTPDGLRLYREFRQVPTGDPLEAALELVFTGTPLDSDYRTGWPPVHGTFVGAEIVGDVIRVEIGDPELLLEHDPPVEQNAMAIEQVIYTAQAAVQRRLPVQFVHNGNPINEVLGRPTSEPLANGPVLETLAHVSLSDPFEGQMVDNDEPFTVTGVGNSFEGTIVTRIQRWEGTYVVDELPAIAGSYEDRLFPFEVTFDLTDVPPGDYVVISRTDDPSGAGRFHTDTRRITVVD